jgi:hypothetical protein
MRRAPRHTAFEASERAGEIAVLRSQGRIRLGKIDGGFVETGSAGITTRKMTVSRVAVVPTDHDMPRATSRPG